MGVRAGQGYGQRKPRRGVCPQCAKRGMTTWRATACGMLRWCQYCQHSEGQGLFELALRRREAQACEAGMYSVVKKNTSPTPERTVTLAPSPEATPKTCRNRR